jgi:general stress protein 26
MSHEQHISSDHESRQKVWDMIRDIRIALMVTVDQDGLLRSRPMSFQQTEYDGKLWFFTRAQAPKVDQIETHEEVLLAFADPEKQNYVSLTGKGIVVDDRAQIKALWSEPMRTWFPKGPDDPDISLICVTVDSAEYWDSPSATMVMAFGYLKARLTGKAPNPGDHKRVEF